MSSSSVSAAPVSERLRIVRGPRAALATHFARLDSRAAGALRLSRRPGSFRGWDAVRRLLVEVEARLGSGVFEAALLRHRPCASLVVHRLEAGLSAAERAERVRYEARLESHLTHNFALQLPIFDGFARLLAEGLEACGAELWVPDLVRLDAESAAVLGALQREHLSRLRGLVAGCDTTWLDPPVDADGLRWPRASLTALNLAYALMADTARWLEPDAAETAEGRAPAAEDEVDCGDDLESRAYRSLAGAAPDAALVAEAVRAAFRSYAFTSALRLGTSLPARPAGLRPADAAELHAILALCAHNRQFRSQEGGPAFESFVLRHLEAAWAEEERPARRSALAYRFAVTFGRRRKELEPALLWAGRAIDEARASGVSGLEAEYLEAWARNIRAYLLLRAERHAAAQADGETAVALVEQAQQRLPGGEGPEHELWTRELLMSRSVLLHNLAALSIVTGRRERVPGYRRAAGDAAAAFAGAARIDAHGWVDLFRETGRYDAALEWALTGLQASREQKDALRAYLYLVNAADLAYRLGAVALSAQLHDEARELRRRCGDPAELLPTDLSRALAHARAGRRDEARGALAAALADASLTPSARAELLSWLGLWAAEDGQAEPAEARLNEAIECAVEEGQRDTLLRVAAVAARAAFLLGRSEEARDAGRRALEIAAAGEAGASEAPASDRLAALVGLGECTSDPELTRQALELLPAALGDAETWWLLERLLRLAARDLSSGTPPCGGPEAGWNALEAAAAQRRDCQARLAELRARRGRAAS